MDGTLVFCNDGILRLKSLYDDNTLIPLKSIQEYRNKNDYSFIIGLLRYDVIIENMTTLGNIFIALEPWKDVFKDLLDTDVEAYIDYVKRPSIAITEFDWINIQNNVNISRKFDYGKLEREDFDTFSQWIHSNKDPVPLDIFNIENKYDICGYKKGDPNNYAITKELSEIKNVPVIFNKTAYLTHYRHSKDSESSLLNESASGIEKQESFYYLKGEAFITLIDLLETIFKEGLFYYSPADASIAHEKVLESLSEMDSITTDISNESDNIKIITNKDTFSDVYHHLDAEIKEWKDIIQKSQQTASILKIGELKIAAIDEERLYGLILEGIKHS